jgi:hypothetical protein
MATLLAAMLVGTGSAQEKNELGGLIGRTFIANQNVPGTNFFDNTIHFGNGLTFEGVYGRHLWGNGFWKLTGEVPVAIDPDEDLNYGQNVIPKQYASFFVTPSARVNAFAENAVSPWASVGGGFGYFKESSDLIFSGPNPGDTGTFTSVFQFGAGLDVKIWKKLTLRGEVRDFWSGVPQLNVDTGKSRQHNIFGGGGVVWHF